jgi:hypothetical protein
MRQRRSVHEVLQSFRGCAWRRRFRVAVVAACAASGLISGAAWAAGVGFVGAGRAPVVREDFVVVVFDREARRQHVLYAARLEPGAGRFALGVPVSGRPEVQVLELDLPGVVHALSAAAEQRRGRSAAVVPSRWATHGAVPTASAVELAPGGRDGSDLVAGLGFDGGWSIEVGRRHPWLAVLEVVPSGARPEAMTAALRVSFASERPVIAWQEPVRRDELPADAAVSAAAREPVVVEAAEAEPVGVAPSADAIGKVLRGNQKELRACLDAMPVGSAGEAATTRTMVVVGPRGQPMTAVPARKGAAEPDDSAPDAGAPRDGQPALEKCVANVLRGKQFPRMDRQWQFSATLRFVAPPVPTRRTHLVLLGRERLAWVSPPPSVTLVRELEPTWADLERALDAPLRAAIGLGGPSGRVWLTEYLDKSEQRHRAPDVELAIAPAPEPTEVKPTPPPPRAKPSDARRVAKRTWHALGAMLVAAAAVVLALVSNRRT